MLQKQVAKSSCQTTWLSITAILQVKHQPSLPSPPREAKAVVEPPSLGDIFSVCNFWIRPAPPPPLPVYKGLKDVKSQKNMTTVRSFII